MNRYKNSFENDGSDHNTHNSEQFLYDSDNEENTCIDDEFFLKIVSNYPPLFNKQHPAFSNRLIKERCWQNVSLSVRATVDICKKKFKALREKYVREKEKYNRAMRSGCAASDIEEWALMSYFRFMMETNNASSTYSSPMDSLEDEMEPVSPQYRSHLNPHVTVPNTFSDTLLNEPVETQSNPNLVLKVASSALSNTIGPQRTTLRSKGVSTTSPLTESVGSQRNPSSTTKRRLHFNDPFPVITRPVELHPKLSNKTNKRPSGEAEPPMLKILDKISNSITEVTSTELNPKDKIEKFSGYVCAELRELPKTEREEFIDSTLIRLLQLKRKK